MENLTNAFLLLFTVFLIVALGYVSQASLFGPVGSIVIILLSVIAIPILTAFALRLYINLFTKISLGKS
ncbi:hypothetical protein EYS14_16680 [Alteromonadaceae bacterium M269]|nr:hypothetical protein EYS14_16680 [Alteromonadaceae bacterium M269]